tara:strand:- start:193 stop:570 length:378 start_codon:yes stop_codon:yes gene_type:complete
MVMKIYEVNGKFFTCKDLAVIEGFNTGFWVKTHELDDTEDLEVERRNDEVIVLDENSNEYNVTFDLSVEEDEVNPETREIVRYHCSDNTRINGELVYKSELSFDLKKRISNEVQDVCDYKDTCDD